MDTFGLDLETTGFVAHRDAIKGISLSVGPRKGQSWWIPFRGDGAISQVKTLRALAPALGDPGKLWVGSNVKFDYKFLKLNMPEGAALGNRFADTVVAHWLIDENANAHGLKPLAKKYLGEEMATFKQASVHDGGLFPEIFADYATEDARQVLRLWRKLEPLLEQEGVTKLFHDIEMGIVRALAEMELTGVGIDLDYLVELSRQMESDVAEAADAAYAGAGFKFDIASSAEVARVMYGDLGLEPQPWMKEGKAGNLPTDKEALREYAGHPVVEAIKRHREASQILKLYCTPYAEMTGDEPRIYAEFKQAGTVAGRFTSNDPNLQQVSPRVKALFRAAAGKKLVCGDFNQLQFRIVGHFARNILGTSVVADAYLAGMDLHTKTQEQMGFTDRRDAKIVNFAFIFGRGWKSFMRANRLGAPEAQQRYHGFHRTYPEVAKLADWVRGDLCKQGWAKSVCGRRRRFPKMRGKVPTGEFGDPTYWPAWVAWNAIVQGCRPIDAPVLTTGGARPMGDLRPGRDRLVTQTGEAGDFLVHRVGRKDVFRVATRLGFDTVTADHRFFAFRGGEIAAVRLRDLSVGDFVLACPRLVEGGELPAVRHREARLRRRGGATWARYWGGPDRPTAGEAELMGMLVGDGSYSARGPHVSFVGKTRAYAEHFRSLFAEAYGLRAWAACRRKRIWHTGTGVADVRERLLQLGMARVKGRAKSVPAWLLTAPAEHRAAFLRGLYDTDGTARGILSLKSVSRWIVEGAAELLWSLGIGCVVRETKGAYRCVVATEYVPRFCEVVGTSRPVRRRHLRVLVQRDPVRSAPAGLLEAVSGYAQASPEWGEEEQEDVTSPIRWANQWGGAGTSVRTRAVTRRRNFTVAERKHVKQMATRGVGSLRACERYLGRLRLDEYGRFLLKAARLPWARVESVVPAGRVEAGDIEILGDDHSYVAGGLLQHNSEGDLVRLSMRNIHRALEAKRAKDKRWREVGLQVQVHDEVMGEAPEELAEEFSALMTHECENALQLAVPIIFECGIGDTWKEAKT